MMTEWPDREVANCGFLTRVSSVELLDRLDHQRRVHDRAVDDGFRRERLDAEALQGELAALVLLELDQLQREAADVEPDDALRPREKGQARYPLPKLNIIAT